MRADDIIRMSIRQRRRFRMFGKPQSRKTEKRKNFSQDELLDYLRRYGIRSAGCLESKRQKGEPKVYDYIKCFGSWKKAAEAAFGKQIVPTVDAMYVVESALLFDVNSYEQYLAVRKKNPVVFPSVYHVRKEFGTFSEFIHCVRRKSLARTLDGYLKLGRRLKKTPTLEDCRTAGVAVDSWMWYFQTMKDLHRMAMRMESEKASEEKSLGKAMNEG